MKTPWLHCIAVALAVCTLGVVITGAWVTSAQRLLTVHRAFGGVVAILAIGVAILLSIAKQHAWLGWTAFAVMIVDAGLGEWKELAWLHACLAPLVLSAVAAIEVVTSRRWAEGAELVQDSGWPSLRSLGNVTPVLVLVQIILGAAFRHHAMGVMPHVLGAMVVALLVLMLTVFVINQFPEHRSLKPAAVVLMTIAFIQVFLGIAAFTMRMVTTENTPAVVGSTVSHVVTGALTLAASVVLTIQIRRNVLKKAA